MDMSGRRHSGASVVRPVAYLHIGAPKTGTTFLQQVLWKNHESLAADGLLYPLRRPFEHMDMALDLRQMTWGGRHDPNWDGAWERVAERVQAWTGTKVVISNELLGGATEQQARQAVESLQPAEVHVVFTARDLARQLPSDWQEQVKHTHTVTLQQFVRDLVELGIEAPDPFGEMFWGLHDAARVLGIWSAAVPVDRIHVVTVPQPGSPSGLLWERFAGLLGIDPDRYDTNVTRTNTSMGLAETELLRRVNAALGKNLGGKYDSLVRVYLAETILSARRETTRVVLPEEYQAWVTARSKELVQQLRDTGCDVVGDLEELIPSPPRPVRDDTSTDGAFTEAQIDAAVEGIVGLLQRVASMPDKDGQLRRRIQGLEEELARRRRQPFKSFVRDVSEQHRAVMRARVAWWHGVELARSLKSVFGRRARSDIATRQGEQ